MDLELGQLGSGGLIEDIKSYDLPPNIFNDTLNVEFDSFAIKPMVKEVAVFDPLPETREPIAFIQGFVAGDVLVYVAACEDSIWLWYMNTWYNITPEEFNDSTDWNLFNFNGYIIVHSPNNYPFYFNPFDFHKPLEVIPSWPEAYFTQYLFGISGFLMGLGLTSGDGYFDRQLVFWSDISEIGQLPANFAFTDPASRAGFVTLPDAEDFIVAKELQNYYVIYRSNSIYNVRFIGGNSVFSFDRKVRNTNLLNRLSVVEVDNLHFFIGKDNFYFYDGFKATPVGKGTIVKTFFETANLPLVQVQLDADLERIFIYYGLPGDIACTYAYIMRYKAGLFFKREINGAQAFSAGYIPANFNGVAWEDLTVTWDEWDETWEIIYQDDRNSKLLWMSGTQAYYIPNDGVLLPAYARRHNIAFAATDQSGAVTVNRALHKLVKKLWPEVESGKLNILFGTKATQQSAYVWGSSKPFDASTDLVQDWIIASKFIAIELNNFDAVSPTDFQLTGLRFEVIPKGKF